MAFSILSSNEAMTGSDVRQRVLAQHEGLRDLLRTVLSVSAAAQHGDVSARSHLVPALSELRGRMLAHLSFEELVLVPALRRADAWGPAAADAVLTEHARQRAELNTLVEGETGAWNYQTVAFILETLAAEILADMDEEERNILTTTVLGNDVVAIDVSRRDR